MKVYVVSKIDLFPTKSNAIVDIVGVSRTVEGAMTHHARGNWYKVDEITWRIDVTPALFFIIREYLLDD